MTVTNGRFAYWWIAKYDETYIEPEYYESSRRVFRGNPVTGLLRGEANDQWAIHLVRQKTVGAYMFDGEQYLMWNDADFDKCTDVSVVKEWMQWQACQNNAMVAGKPLGSTYNASDLDASPNGNVVSVFNVHDGDNLGPGVPHWMHTQAHIKIGSYIKPASGPVLHCPGECPGDMTDVATSPNDVFFWFFHANLDRMNLKWLANLGWFLSQNETSFDDVNYPSSQRAFFQEQMVRPYRDAPYPLLWTAAANGTTLDDVINSGYAFKKNIFTGDASDDALLTHRDVLEATYSDALPYEYAEPAFVQGTHAHKPSSVSAAIVAATVVSVGGATIGIAALIYLYYGCGHGKPVKRPDEKSDLQINKHRA